MGAASAEAVGVPATFKLCEDIVAPGGTIANIGVHGKKVELHLERLWSHNVTITTRLVDSASIPMLLKIVQSRRIDAAQLITHRFANVRESDRVVVLSAGPATHPIGEFDIDLPRPRDVTEQRTHPRAIALHSQIWAVLREEVLKAYAQQLKKAT